MAFKAIKTYLPELFHPLLPDIFSKETPGELFTDCPECHMICSSLEEVGHDESRPFSPDTKCCTYVPHYPIFLPGEFSVIRIRRSMKVEKYFVTGLILK